MHSFRSRAAKASASRRTSLSPRTTVRSARLRRRHDSRAGRHAARRADSRVDPERRSRHVVGRDRNVADVRSARTASRRSDQAGARGGPLGGLRSLYRRDVRLPRRRPRSAPRSARSLKREIQRELDPDFTLLLDAPLDVSAGTNQRSLARSLRARAATVLRARARSLSRPGVGGPAADQDHRRSAAACGRATADRGAHPTHSPVNSAITLMSSPVAILSSQLCPWLAPALEQFEAARRVGQSRSRLADLGTRRHRQDQFGARAWPIACSASSVQPAELDRSRRRSLRCAARHGPLDHHPDLHWLYPEEDKETISVDQVRDAHRLVHSDGASRRREDRDHRARRGDDERGRQRAAEDARGALRRQLSAAAQSSAGTVGGNGPQPLPTLGVTAARGRRRGALAATWRCRRCSRRGAWSARHRSG